MKYAKEVIELMSSYPGRDFKKVEIIRAIRHGFISSKSSSISKGIQRVLNQLIDAGHVTKHGDNHITQVSYYWNCPNIRTSSNCKLGQELRQ